MIVSEDEARKKWCPYAGSPRYSRQDEYCEASICMAWRWHKVLVEEGSYNIWPSKPARYETSTTHGYCGLVRGLI